VGVQPQSSTLPAKLKVGELLDLYRSFYPQAADASELVEMLGLAGKRGDYFRSLSGGQKQRLSIALAPIGRPRVVVLDEMTTGLDPHARRDTWEMIEQVRDRGVTILLVTHYMEEAARLCDRLALVDQGRVVAAGTPQQLAGQADGGRQVRFEADEEPGPLAPRQARLGLRELGALAIGLLIAGTARTAAAAAAAGGLAYSTG
jgi:ABC-2 type transport system ATP-binding protein